MTHDFSHRSKSRKEKSTKKVKPRFKVPAWFWLTCGLALGVFSTLYFSQKYTPVNSASTPTQSDNTLSAEELAASPSNTSTPIQVIDTQEPQEKSEATSEKNAEQASDKDNTKVDSSSAIEETPTVSAEKDLKFSFYTVLSEQEVMVNELQTPEPDKPAAATKTQIPTKQEVANQSATPKSYMLQAGSFLHNGDALKLHQKIKSAGLDVNIEQGIVTRDNIETIWHRVIVGPFNNSEDINQAKQVLESLKIESLLMRRSS